MSVEHAADRVMSASTPSKQVPTLREVGERLNVGAVAAEHSHRLGGGAGRSPRAISAHLLSIGTPKAALGVRCQRFRRELGGAATRARYPLKLGPFVDRSLGVASSPFVPKCVQLTTRQACFNLGQRRRPYSARAPEL